MRMLDMVDNKYIYGFMVVIAILLLIMGFSDNKDYPTDYHRVGEEVFLEDFETIKEVKREGYIGVHVNLGVIDEYELENKYTEEELTQLNDKILTFLREIEGERYKTATFKVKITVKDKFGNNAHYEGLEATFNKEELGDYGLEYLNGEDMFELAETYELDKRLGIDLGDEELEEEEDLEYLNTEIKSTADLDN